jgi:hypothetical protein
MKIVDTIKQLADRCLTDIRQSPRPEHLRGALERVRQNPTEFLRAYQWKDNAELGRLLAHEIDNEIMRVADAEARKLAASMGL